MNKPCDQLGAYLDGELPEAEAAAFRLHLAECPDCPAQLDSALQLAGLSPPPARKPKKTRISFEPHWARRAAVVAALAVACALVVIRAPLPENVWYPDGSDRSIEARLVRTGDRYHPYAAVAHGPESPVKAPGLLSQLLLAIRGDHVGLAEAYLARNQPELAKAELADALPSNDVDAALALVAWQQKEYPRALGLASKVLERNPGHLPARWTRALALERLELPMAAAEEFLEVAKAGEPGWSGEAQQRAAALQKPTLQRTRGWVAALDASRKLVLEGGPLPSARDVREHPGTWRSALYDAVRGAQTRQAVEALAPIATELDALEESNPPSTRLADFVAWAAKQDFGRRGPLGVKYRKVVAHQLSAEETKALLEAAEAARQPDLVLGVLHRGGLMGREPERVARLRQALEDNWSRWLVSEELGRAALARGDYFKAKEELTGGTGCPSEKTLAFRCAWRDLRAIELYTELHQLDEANEIALGSLRLSREIGEWGLEQRLLQHLAQIARIRRDLPLMRAYLLELLAQAALDRPELCPIRNDAHEMLASGYIFELKPDQAARELAKDGGCASPSLFRSWLQVDLARQKRDSSALPRVRAELEALREGPLTPGQRLYASRLIAETELLQGWLAAVPHLEQVISEAEGLPDDPNARKARAYAFSSLVREAGNRGAWNEVLRRAAAERSIPEPARCVLVVESNDEIRVLAGRDRDGQLFGEYRNDVKDQFEVLTTFRGVVPEWMVDRLRPCETIDVLALPPAAGRKELLPPDLAWSYRLSAPAPVPPGPRSRLIVTGIPQPPEKLHLGRLVDWQVPEDGPRTSVLSGRQATPLEVSKAMEDASEIVFNTHAMASATFAPSYLVLSPDASGRFELYDRVVRQLKLTRAPIVFLGACNAAETAPYPHEPMSLPEAFIAAGARAVLAPAAKEVPDVYVGQFFEEVARRINEGQPPSVATRDLRMEWASKHQGEWTRDVLVFE